MGLDIRKNLFHVHSIRSFSIPILSISFSYYRIHPHKNLLCQPSFILCKLALTLFNLFFFSLFSYSYSIGKATLFLKKIPSFYFLFWKFKFLLVVIYYQCKFIIFFSSSCMNRFSSKFINYLSIKNSYY